MTLLGNNEILYPQAVPVVPKDPPRKRLSKTTNGTGKRESRAPGMLELRLGESTGFLERGGDPAFVALRGIAKQVLELRDSPPIYNRWKNTLDALMRCDYPLSIGEIAARSSLSIDTVREQVKALHLGGIVERSIGEGGEVVISLISLQEDDMEEQSRKDVKKQSSLDSSPKHILSAREYRAAVS